MVCQHNKKLNKCLSIYYQHNILNYLQVTMGKVVNIAVIGGINTAIIFIINCHYNLESDSIACLQNIMSILRFLFSYTGRFPNGNFFYLFCVTLKKTLSWTVVDKQVDQANWIKSDNFLSHIFKCWLLLIWQIWPVFGRFSQHDGLEMKEKVVWIWAVVFWNKFDFIQHKVKRILDM